MTAGRPNGSDDVWAGTAFATKPAPPRKLPEAAIRTLVRDAHGLDRHAIELRRAALGVMSEAGDRARASADRLERQADRVWAAVDDLLD